MIFYLKRFLKSLLLVSLTFLVMLSFFKMESIHRIWLRNKVANKVFEIRGKVNGGGGTGFAIKAPTGISYIVTNSHVCEYALKEGDKTLLLVIKDGHSMKRRVLEISGESDLCLIEGWPGLEGLEVGLSPKIGDVVHVVGHPLLLPTTMMSGEITSSRKVSIAHHVMLSGNVKRDKMFGATAETCEQPKNEVKMVEFKLFGVIPLGQIKMCFVNEQDAMFTNVTIYPGNSGSPVVDSSGKVLGVVFASNTETNWGWIVNLSNLQHFLQDF